LIQTALGVLFDSVFFQSLQFEERLKNSSKLIRNSLESPLEVYFDQFLHDLLALLGRHLIVVSVDEVAFILRKCLHVVA